MKRFSAGILVTLAIVLVIRSCADSGESGAVLQESSTLIQEQMANVSKLVVTEGHFSEVYNYRDSKELFGPLLTAQKKALVVVNAEVAISYDLSLLEYMIDGENQILALTHIPEPEIRIDPDFEYYDVTADYLNPFEAGDYNTIKRNVRNALLKKIEASNLRTNAQNRLLSELQKFYILTNSLGWTITYNGEVINEPNGFPVGTLAH